MIAANRMVRARLTKTPATLPPSDQKPPFWPSPGNGLGGAVGVVVMVRNAPVTVRMVVIGVGVHDDVEALTLVDELDDAIDGKGVVDSVDEDRLRVLMPVLGSGDDVVCPENLELAPVLTIDEVNRAGSSQCLRRGKVSWPRVRRRGKACRWEREKKVTKRGDHTVGI